MAWHSGFQVWLSETQSLENAQLIVNHFKASDWTKESLAAMIGNMRHESSINPNMYEYGYGWEEDRGYGLVQWTPRSKYWTWAVSQGLDPESGDSQLDRIDYEATNNIQWIANRLSISPPYPPGLSSYRGSFTDFRSNKDGLSLNELTEAFMWNYEGPAYSAAVNSLADRQAFAQRALNELDWSGSGGGGKSKPQFPTLPELPITSKYGYRGDIGVPGASEYHWAIDIGSGGISDPPIYATQNGEVMETGTYSNGGIYVIIKHNSDPYWSRYLHLKSYSVSVGQKVSKGETIGIMGNTGIGSGVHLDFAISINGTFGTEQDTIDPEIYLEMEFDDGGNTPDPEPEKGDDVIDLLLIDALNGWKW